MTTTPSTSGSTRPSDLTQALVMAQAAETRGLLGDDRIRWWVRRSLPRRRSCSAAYADSVNLDGPLLLAPRPHLAAHH